MPATTIHLPPALLAALDDRARQRGVSRNRLIVQAVESMLAEDAEWDPAFLAELSSPLEAEDGRELDRMVEAIRERRTRKAPPRL